MVSNIESSSHSNMYFAIGLCKSTSEELSISHICTIHQVFPALWLTYLITPQQSPNHSHLNRHLDYNAIENFDNITLSHPHSIQNLRLEGNLLDHVPTKLLIGFSSTLEAL